MDIIFLRLVLQVKFTLSTACLIESIMGQFLLPPQNLRLIIVE